MNELQLEAVKSLNNTLVIAGAGSGKTYTIINKINYLIENKIYKESEILAISFTNESVNDLKRKIKYNVSIKTFHKLSLDLINNKNIKICKDNYLKYIITEYLNSYVKYNFKTKLRIKRLLFENTYNKLVELLITFINLYKSNYNDIDYLINIYNKSHFIYKDYLLTIIEIYKIYQNELASPGLVDFNDMINYATNNILSNKIKTNYKLIIIDEFQDTSLNRFNLINSIIKQNNGLLFAVGDDYQSIYRFSGCNLDIFLNLNKYIKNLQIINLDYNYRNNQELINIANNFIMKNKLQIKKHTICLKHSDKPIKIINYVNKKEVINKLINIINDDYLILGRYNKDKEEFNIKDNFLTIHSSKGLENKNIILIANLPSKIKNHEIINKIIPNDYFPYEEERRLFYVALTRTKNNIYILNNQSIFIKELIKDNKKYIEYINIY